MTVVRLAFGVLEDDLTSTDDVDAAELDASHPGVDASDVEPTGSNSSPDVDPPPDSTLSPDRPVTTSTVEPVAGFGATACKTASLDPPTEFVAALEALELLPWALAEPVAVGGVDGALLGAGAVAGAADVKAPPPPPPCPGGVGSVLGSALNSAFCTAIRSIPVMAPLPSVSNSGL